MTALRTVADLMEIAARTAPKAKGQDFVVVKVLEGQEVEQLAQAMFERAEQTGVKGWERDGRNTQNSGAVVLVGLKDAEACGLNCGACGAEKCMSINADDREFNGPQCALRVLDMGIALGSAVKIAALMNVDNRVMYRIGALAREVGLIDADFVMGVPLSVTGKSIYFDR